MYAPNLWQFSPEEWRDGIDFAHAANASINAQRGRFSAVRTAIAKAGLAGELDMALRQVAGGNVGPVLPVHVWNTERYQQRFHLCQMSPSDPFGLGLAGPGFQYIFVSRESLDKFLSKLAPPAPKTETPALRPTQRKKFKAWLRGVIENSPNMRSMTKEKIAEVREQHNVSRDEGNAVRREILADMPAATKKAWTVGGRERGLKNRTEG
jgi:hypothetical protein